MKRIARCKPVQISPLRRGEYIEAQVGLLALAVVVGEHGVCFSCRSPGPSARDAYRFMFSKLAIDPCRPSPLSTSRSCIDYLTEKCAFHLLYTCSVVSIFAYIVLYSLRIQWAPPSHAVSD